MTGACYTWSKRFDQWSHDLTSGQMGRIISLDRSVLHRWFLHTGGSLPPHAQAHKNPPAPQRFTLWRGKQWSNCPNCGQTAQQWSNWGTPAACCTPAPSGGCRDWGTPAAPCQPRGVRVFRAETRGPELSRVTQLVHVGNLLGHTSGSLPTPPPETPEPAHAAPDRIHATGT